VGAPDADAGARIEGTHYVTVMVEEDTDTGQLLYEEWADAKLARVRLVPFDDSGRSTVYTVDLTWRRQSEVRAGFALAIGILTGHEGTLTTDGLCVVISASVDAQAWPEGDREQFVLDRLAMAAEWAAEEVA
jgi:hypothetical protein